MAITATHILENQSDVDAASYNTASGDATDGRLQIFAVHTRRVSAQPSQPTLSGGGVTTWTHIRTLLYDDGGATRGRVDAFRAYQASYGAAAAVTIDYGGVTQGRCEWTWAEFAGTVTTGTNGADAIVQSGDTGANLTGLSGTVTLSAFASANNAAFGFFGHHANETNTLGSTFTGLNAGVNGANPASSSRGEWKINDNTVDMSWATSTNYGGVAIEIAEAAAATTSLIWQPAYSSSIYLR